jgi:hypothetical protein
MGEVLHDLQTMRAIEATGTVDAQGHIQLDTPLPQAPSSRVRVVMLLDEQTTDKTPSAMPSQPQSQPRISGQDQGKVWISDDFNAPLPETILNDFIAPL